MPKKRTNKTQPVTGEVDKSRPPVHAPKVQGKPKTVTQKGWEFAPFTKKAVCFSRAAKALSKRVKDTYGNQVSIAQFEKLCIAYPTLSVEGKDLIFLEAEAIQLLVDYQRARDERDSERATFRGERPNPDVESAMALLRTAFGGVGNPTSPEAGGDSDTSMGGVTSRAWPG
jgi:hypothetical protein